MDVAAWLQGLGLDRYVPAFLENRIEADILPSLTVEDLKDLGVTLVGDRRRLLDAIAALGAGVPPAATPVAAPDAPAPAEAERRQLTVMFCDLVGSTALSTRFDPEDLRELIGDYHRAVADTVARLDGFVAKYMGDGVLIYFGYPQAHEDDAERAVRAGLAVIEAVGRSPAREDLRVRIGIATGLVVVGDLIGEGAAQEQAVVGETPNLAARLQALAAPNALVIGEATRRQVGGLFELGDLGPQALAGLRRAAARLAGRRRERRCRAASRPCARARRRSSAATRRSSCCCAAGSRPRRARGACVLISAASRGSASRALRRRSPSTIGTEPRYPPRYFCSPHHQDSALYPVIVQLERAAGFARDDGPRQNWKNRRRCSDRQPDGDGCRRAVVVARRQSSRATRTERRSATRRGPLRRCSAARRAGPSAAGADAIRGRPLDRSDLARVARPTIRTGRPSAGAVLVATFRPEFIPPWVGQPHVTVLALNRLGRSDGAVLVERLVGNAGLCRRCHCGDRRAHRTGAAVRRGNDQGVHRDRCRDAAARLPRRCPRARLAVPPTLQAFADGAARPARSRQPKGSPRSAPQSAANSPTSWQLRSANACEKGSGRAPTPGRCRPGVSARNAAGGRGPVQARPGPGYRLQHPVARAATATACPDR